MGLNKLFFVPHTKSSNEISEYYSLEDFHNVLVEECNFCNTDSLNIKRLNEIIMIFCNSKIAYFKCN